MLLGCIGGVFTIFIYITGDLTMKDGSDKYPGWVSVHMCVCPFAQSTVFFFPFDLKVYTTRFI